MTACHENVKLQHGPSAVKSSNYSMDHLAWNREITGWAICHEIVKLQDGPPPMKLSNHSMGQLPWNCQITVKSSNLPWNRQIAAWAICHEIGKSQDEIVKSQHEPKLPWKCKNLVWLDSVVWIWKLFSVMCFWFFAPTYYVFGLRMHFRWCAFGELRQNINCQNTNCLAH